MATLRSLVVSSWSPTTIGGWADAYRPTVTLRPPAGRAWQIISWREVPSTVNGDLLGFAIGAEIIAEVGGANYIERQLALSDTPVNLTINEWPLWNYVPAGSELDIWRASQVVANINPGELLFWELDDAETPPAPGPGTGGGPGGNGGWGGGGWGWPKPPTPPVVVLPPGTPGGPYLPPPDPSRPPVIWIDGEAEPFDLPPPLGTGDFGAQAFRTRLTEGLTRGLEPREMQQITPVVARALAHLVGADRYRSRLVRASPNGSLAAAPSHLRHLGGRVTRNTAGSETFTFPAVCAGFRATSLSGRWYLLPLNEDQFRAGTLPDELAMMNFSVGPGETIEVPMETRLIWLGVINPDPVLVPVIQIDGWA